MNLTQALVRNKGGPEGQLDEQPLERAVRNRSLTTGGSAIKPQVVGPAHSSVENLETDWSEGAGLFKC